jgi:ribosomal protein L11 methyltransferase
LKTWTAVDVTGEFAAREAIEYGLMEAGSLGTETRPLDENLTRVTAYFDRQREISDFEGELFEALRIYNFPRSSLHDISIGEIENRDWLAEWKKSWQPVTVGRFIIAAPWLPQPESVDAIIIRINPGMAFGTGTHETTRLCLQAIAKHYRCGSFLDVGTGTGILAIAAAKMCSKSDRAGGPTIIACDTDEDAITIAKENAELNDVAEQIDFHAGSVDGMTPSTDFVCANLTAPVIVELLPALIGATCGRLILSGILDSQIEMVKSGLAELGVMDFETTQDGEWIALTI